MTKISYFQRYSQRENHVTNNTLLVLRHLYQIAPVKLEQVVRELVGREDVNLGLTFQQQNRGSDSTPDGFINQEPVSLHFETKLGASLDRGQVIRHITSINNDNTRSKGKAFLVGLTTESMPSIERTALEEEAKKKGIIFSSTTFAKLRDALEGICEPHDVALRAILDDFFEYLKDENLLFQGDDWMLVFPCGTSLSENELFGVYYEGPERPKRSQCTYIGAYSEKSIRLIGRITAVLICEYIDESVKVIEVERGSPTSDDEKRINGIINATSYYDLKSRPQRYYVLDEFAPTNLIKRNKGPIRGAQYLQISPLLQSRMQVGELTSRELAKQLNGRSFPLE